MNAPSATSATPGKVVRPVAPSDAPAIHDLHVRAFGPGRFARTAYRLREGTLDASPFCRVCVIGGTLVAAVRFTPVLVGDKAGVLLLGPLAVNPAYANLGHGRALVMDALADAKAAGIRLALLVGDEPYYGKLGFKRVPRGQITLPGPVNPDRLLAIDLAGTLAEFSGLVTTDPAARRST